MHIIPSSWTQGPKTPTTNASGEPTNDRPDACVSLLYSSTAAYPMRDEALLDLLAQSRAHNQQRGITGMLIYHDGSFMQYLEGAKDEVLTLYFEREIDARRFADWSMGFMNLERVDPTAIERFTLFMEQGFMSETAVEQPTMAMRLLLQFRDFEH